MKVLLMMAMMLLSPLAARGDVILYKVPNGEVVEAFREPIPPQLGYDQVTVVNADLIVWPASMGCAAASKNLSKVVLPVTNPPTFILNPKFEFFKCKLVSNMVDVDQATLVEVEKLQAGQSNAELLRQGLWAVYMLSVKCPPTDSSTQCNTDRTKARAIETNLTGLNAQIEVIQKEAADFKAAQGW